MAQLTIIAAHLGSPTLLEETLLSVLSNRPDDCEIFVAGRPYDDPYELEGEVRFIAMRRRAGLIECWNAGVAKSRSRIVHLLVSGVEVAEGWADAALEHFDDPRVAAVAPVAVDHEHPEQVLTAGMSYHAAGVVRPLARGAQLSEVLPRPRSVLAPHPAAGFYRRSVLDRIGWLDGRPGGRFATVDLGLTLRAFGLRTVLEPGCRVALRPEATFRRGAFRDAVESERFFWRWATTIGIWRSLLLHGILLTGESVRSLCNLSILARWAGRLAGACLALGRRGAARRVGQIREALGDRLLDSSVKAPHFPTTARPKRTASADALRQRQYAG